MDKVKASVSSLLSRDGKHDTTVHETIQPAVVNEHVTKTQHEQQQTVVDREVHQDHFHTSVQPIKDREVLPEQHITQQQAAETRHVNHGNDAHVKERLAREAAQFKDQRTVGETQHTQADAGVVAGEHVHHHIHENIQPVIQKETIQPSVVHTIKPVHEIHSNEAKHHTATQLPAVSLSEFKNQCGHLSGREERTDSFEGAPKAVGGTLGGAGAHGTTSLTENEGRHGHSSTSHSTTSGPHGSNAMNKADPRVDSDRDGSRTVGNTGTGYNNTTSGSTIGSHSSAPHTTGTGVGHNTTGTGVGHNAAHTEHKKPSLMDKLNPKVDANGDGKAGFMK